MKASDRIKAICAAVAEGETVADIGTDHAYVPLILYKSQISPSVIMCDISEESLSKARSSFQNANIVMPESAFRVGNGLDVIKAGEVDDVIIAGLGGLTIVDILSETDKLYSFKKLILQPRNNSGCVRSFLYEKGFDIITDLLVMEGNFSCEVIVALRGEICLTDKYPGLFTIRELPYGKSDIRWRYPRVILQSEKRVVLNRLQHAINNHVQEINNLRRSREDNGNRIRLVKSELKYLRELKGEIDE